jgi:peptidoglycan/LPS O-acetylase OafA/YrhL
MARWSFCMSVFQAIPLYLVESGRANNLKLLRFLFATGVVLSHCCVLLGPLDQEPMHRIFNFSSLGEVAVFGFFFLSGYLIVKSGVRWSTPDDFLAARALRIFPALICTVLLCTFVMGPLVTMLPLSSYLSSPLTRHYLLQILLHKSALHTLPGVFADSPVFQSANQPLWTLSSEWLMYIVVLILCMALRWFQGMRFSAGTWLAASGALLLTAQMMPFQGMQTVRWAVLFVLGGACFIARRRVTLSLPTAVFVMSADLVLLRIVPHLAKPIFPVALCYLILVLGYHPKVYVHWFNRLGDYSYGIYIYGWPLQQLCLPLAHGSPIRLFAMAYPCVLAMSVVSWHALEARALQFKPSHRAADRHLAPTLTPAEQI